YCAVGDDRLFSRRRPHDALHAELEIDGTGLHRSDLWRHGSRGSPKECSPDVQRNRDGRFSLPRSVWCYQVVVRCRKASRVSPLSERWPWLRPWESESNEQSLV